MITIYEALNAYKCLPALSYLLFTASPEGETLIILGSRAEGQSLA